MQLDSRNLAVLVLTIFVGIALVNVLTNSFLRFFIAIAVLMLVFSGLVSGRSPLIETLTDNLGWYFAREPFGLIGVIVGVVIGTGLRKKK